MKDRLIELMKSEGLTAVKFAEIMEVQPSGISHLLTGRNKPNFDFISKLLLRFPELNPDWIINGQGNIYRSNIPVDKGMHTNVTHKAADVVTNVTTPADLFSKGNLFENTDSENDPFARFSDTYNSNNRTDKLNEVADNHIAEQKFKNIPPPVLQQSEQQQLPRSSNARVNRAILLYDDGSYEILDKQI